MDLESAAAVLGVHYQTAYRWVRTGLLDAVKVGATYELDPDHVVAVAEERRGDGRSGPEGQPNCAEAAAILSGCLAGGDDAGARRLVEQLQRDGLNLTALCDLVIAPALRWLHDEWTVGLVLAGEIVVAVDICERLVGLLASPPRGRPRGLALVASPEGERHRLPGLMATVALRADRWRVHHLGCGAPAEDLADFVVAEQPDLLVLSVATAEAAAEAVRTMIGDAVPVLAGAPGATLAELTAAAKQLCVTRRRPSGGPRTEQPVPWFAPAANAAGGF
jgi:MerR family transcriptional regulator, light-induced transcriptional regulator